MRFRLVRVTTALVILCGGLFVVAGARKLLAPAEVAGFLHALASTGDFVLTVRAVGAWEVFLGLSLMLAPTSRGALAAFAATLTIFTLVLIAALQREVDHSCGCLGLPKAWAMSFQNHGVGVARNVSLLLVAAAHAVAVRASGGGSRVPGSRVPAPAAHAL